MVTIEVVCTIRSTPCTGCVCTTSCLCHYSTGLKDEITCFLTLSVHHRNHRRNKTPPLNSCLWVVNDWWPLFARTQCTQSTMMHIINVVGRETVFSSSCQMPGVRLTPMLDFRHLVKCEQRDWSSPWPLGSNQQIMVKVHESWRTNLCQILCTSTFSEDHGCKCSLVI